ncbi:hypothetical protein QBC44DRAFT_113031 [Cladorrhinum sp. PSN332]|nr:hypothetical protein QBC44DRAFT_113031 [Cladorrhinum sp. PSN332]
MAPPIITGLPTLAKQSTPKAMSSRLMTMKFMQRGAAAAAAAASPISPSSPATPQSADSSSSKRRKFSHAGSATGTPATPLYDQKAIQAALEEEEKKRLAAVEKRAAELGDSHWVLPGASTLPRNGTGTLNVVTVGFAQIDYPAASGRDYEDDGDNNPFEESAPPPPSSQIRRFNMKTKKQEKQEDSGENSDSNSDSNSGSEEGEVEDDETSHKNSKRRRASTVDDTDRGPRDTTDDASLENNNRRRSIVSNRKLEEQKKAAQFAGKRRAKEIKLNQLSSISGGGASQPRSPATLSCHSCGKPGHKAVECPTKSRKC